MLRQAGLIIAIAVATAHAASAAPLAPMRPLPTPSTRPASAGPSYFVDPIRGSATGDGTRNKPWQTIDAAANRLKPGDTLYLRGGIYFEHVSLSASGTASAPITIRSAPGELAILDGAVPEFEQSPQAAWEPAPGGAPGEFRSVHAFADLRKDSDGGRGVWILGNFADSMIPLHGYRFAEDLRSDNPYWNLADKATPGNGIYLGPGVWFDWQTHRIHIRLAPTKLAAQPANYTGETDPRKLPLVIGIDHNALSIHKASHLRIIDVEIRGAAGRTVEIADSSDIVLDGVTIYGGAPALYIAATDHLRIIRSALRGTAAPWSSRASMKYRGNSPYLLVAGSLGAQSHDWELAYNDFTDGHDGLVIDSVKNLAFHHNRIDNLNDDGIYLALPPRAHAPEGVTIYENQISRVYTVLSFAEADDRNAPPTPIGPGVYIYRNLFDLREPTYNEIPPSASARATLSPSRMCGDHGSPIWEPLFIYHNTVVTAGNAFRNYYAAQLVMGTRNTKRRLYNNIFVQLDGSPGQVVPRPTDDLQADGNLQWSLRTSATATAPFGAHDQLADPKLTHLADRDPTIDARLLPGSPAIDAGVPIPADWPDSLRAADRGKSDIGALPLGAPMLRTGPAASPPAR